MSLQFKEYPLADNAILFLNNDVPSTEYTKIMTLLFPKPDHEIDEIGDKTYKVLTRGLMKIVSVGDDEIPVYEASEELTYEEIKAVLLQKTRSTEKT